MSVVDKETLSVGNLEDVRAGRVNVDNRGRIIRGILRDGIGEPSADEERVMSIEDGATFENKSKLYLGL